MSEYEAIIIDQNAQTLDTLHTILILVQSFFVVVGILISALIAWWFVRRIIMGSVRSYINFRM